MKLPSTRFCVLLRTMPSSALPEIRLPAPAAVPPMSCNGASTKMPRPPLGMAAVPAALVPIRLPSTTLPLPLLKWMPSPPLPAMRLPAPAPAPPMVVLATPPRKLPKRMPWPPFGTAAVPAASVPM
jgi:hypothetical protein